MNRITFLLWFSFMFMTGIYFLFYSKNEVEGLSLREKTIKDLLISARNNFLSDTPETNALFTSMRMPIKVSQYNLIRVLITLVLVFYGMLKFYQTKSMMDMTIAYVLALVFYIFSAPKEKVLGVNSPFIIAARYFKVQQQKEYDKELYKAIGQLKSICITNQDNPKSGDAIMEELIRYTNLTRPIFAQTLSLIRLQQYETARTFFTTSIGTKLSRDFIHVLLELDSIDPKEFIQQLKVFQDAEREKRLTERLNQQENLSIILYTPAMTTCTVVLLNFIMCTLWVSARSGMIQ